MLIYPRNVKMNKTIIDLLRHGEPEGGRMYRGGGTDHVLSESGWQMMHDSIDKNRANWSAIVSSPMLRCREFSEQFATEMKLPLDIKENFKEAGYGAWEGKTPAEIIEHSEDEYWAFFDDPVNHRPNNAEQLEIFTPRINDVFGEVLEEYDGKHILLVSHLAVTRAIIGIILGMPLASQQLIDMPFAGMLRIINDRKGLRLVLL